METINAFEKTKKLSKDQNRTLLVLKRIMKQVEDDEDYAESYSDFLDHMLDDMQGYDVFGTECQDDPRGDFRDGAWEMRKVQGIDK